MEDTLTLLVQSILRAILYTAIIIGLDNESCPIPGQRLPALFIIPSSQREQRLIDVMDRQGFASFPIRSIPPALGIDRNYSPYVPI